jgi:hypothetical protein
MSPNHDAVNPPAFRDRPSTDSELDRPIAERVVELLENPPSLCFRLLEVELLLAFVEPLGPFVQAFQLLLELLGPLRLAFVVPLCQLNVFLLPLLLVSAANILQLSSDVRDEFLHSGETGVARLWGGEDQMSDSA